MDRVRTNNVTLIKKLTSFHKPYFSVADLEKILDLDRDSLYVALNRLVKSVTKRPLLNGAPVSLSATGSTPSS